MEYFNPQSINPGNNWKPDGFLGGMMWGQDRARYNQLAPLQDFMQMLSARGEMNKHQDYELDAPVRSANRLSDIATSGATAATIMGQKQGELEQLGLANQFNKATLSDRIKEKALAVAKSGREGAMEEMIQGVTIADIFSRASANGPDGMRMVQQQLQEAGIKPDHPLAKMLLAQGLNAPKVAAEIRKGLDEASGEFRKARMTGELENKGKRDVANINASSALAVAKERAASKNKTAKQAMIEASKRGAEAAYITSQAVLADADIDTPTRAMAIELARQSLPGYEEAKRKSGSTLGPDGTINPMPRPNLQPGQQPQSGIINFGDLK